jgi:hypothetical protein
VLDHGFERSYVGSGIDDGPVSHRSGESELLIESGAGRTEDGNPVAEIRAEPSDVARQHIDVFPDRKTLRPRLGLRRHLGLCEKVLDPGGDVPQGLGSRLEIHIHRQHGISPDVDPPESIDLSLIQHLDLLRVDDTEATRAITAWIESKMTFSDN